MRSTPVTSITRGYENMELFTAIENENVEEISSLLKNKQSFMKKDKNGFTPLLLAACKLGPVYTEVYNAKKELYDEKLDEGEQMSALHFACCARDRNFVRRLLIRGADINERIPESCPLWPGYTPLQLCIELEFEDVARALLCRSADVRIVCPNGLTTIFMAENKRLHSLTPAMLRMYTSWTVNPVDKKSGNNYLHLACKYGLVNVVEALLHHGADVNMQSDATPLHMANDASVVKVLLRYGANLGLKSRFGETPLHKAFYEEHDEAVEAMLEGHGQCRANPVDASGLSHLHIACRRGSEAAVKSILEHSIVDINASTPLQHHRWTRYSPLHFAVKGGSVEVVQLLLDHGATLDIINGNGWTPLHLAVSLRSDTSIAQVLLDAGAKIDVKGLHFNLTPLHVAAQFNRPNHVALLLQRGADWSATATEDRWSSLHVACQKLYVEVVRLLPEYGADPNAKGGVLPSTALHVCARANREIDSNGQST